METSSTLPPTIHDVPTPSFLVDIDRVKQNAKNMIERCKQLGVSLRPHMKTHKTIEGGEILTAGKKRAIEVSTLKEVEFYANAGFDDILYGFPIIEAKVERCKQLSSKLSEFHLMIENQEGFKALENNPLVEPRKWSVYVEIDTGFKRTGARWDSEEAVDLVQLVLQSNHMTLKGLYTHDGNSYSSKDQDGIKTVSRETYGRLSELGKRIQKRSGVSPDICQGSTPSLSCPDDILSNLKECTPGNYVFYDYMQTRIGSCKIDDIACRIATRVIAHKSEMNMICIDCGFLGLSQDGFSSDMSSGPCLFQENPNLKLIGVTQEIGKVIDKDGDIDFKKYPIGTLLFIYPNHACAAAAMHPVYYVHSGNKVITTWTPTRGW